MDKKGVDLTLNIIVIAVLVVIALIVLVVFFLGGFGRITDKIKGTSIATTAGTDLILAVQVCEQYCDQAEVLLPENVNLVPGSAYCTKKFDVDRNGDGVIEDNEKEISCKTLGVGCTKIEDKCTS